MSEAAKGALATAIACTIWGLSPIYYKYLDHIPAAEVMSHRVIWSFVIFYLILLASGQLRRFWAFLKPSKQSVRLILAALMVSANWFLFIWAVQVERVTEVSLGYFFQPLVAVAFGYLLFFERPLRLQWIAVAMAVVAVAVLTVGQGGVPWIPLVLAVTFAFYGVLKKRMTVGATISVTAEALIVAPFCLVWVIGSHLDWWTTAEGLVSGAFGRNFQDSALLIFSGALTAGPLVMVSWAAQRIRLATFGLLQYINPSFQFLCAIVLFQEVLSQEHLIAFPLIWMALALYSYAALGSSRSSVASKSSTESTT